MKSSHLIAEAVKEEKKPINQYGKTSYFRDMYGQSMGTVNNRKEGIRREIKSGRYPESALIERFIDKAVYADYNRFFKHLEGAGQGNTFLLMIRLEAMVLVRKMEGETSEQSV